MSTLQVLSWNIRQGGGTRFTEILAALTQANPAVMVLSEFRNNAAGLKLRTGLLKHGYLYQVASGATGDTNSVLIASRYPCGSAVFPESDPNYFHAMVRADLPAFRLYGVYFPHKKKHRLFEFLLEEELDDDLPSIIAGDWNTGKNGIDQKGNSFWYSEHLTSLEKRGYADAFRVVHADAEEYSWYSHKGNGFRYDHTYVQGDLVPLIRDCHYLHEWREDGLSDHSPMVVEFGD